MSKPMLESNVIITALNRALSLFHSPSHEYWDDE